MIIFSINTYDLCSCWFMSPMTYIVAGLSDLRPIELLASITNDLYRVVEASWLD